MKGRVIGGLWIIAALCLFYFGWGGQYFNFLLFACFLMAAMEIYEIVCGEYWRMDPSACRPRNAWAIQLMILCFAMLSILFLERDEAAVVGLICIFSDVGAFAFGKLIGKHRVKAIKRISPNKTWEGYLGGNLIAWLTGFITCHLFGIALTPGVIIFIALSGLISEIGDLLGSATKRQLGVKDSGEALAIFPITKWIEYPLRGHGGYLDRVDSISLGIVVYAIITTIAS